MLNSCELVERTPAALVFINDGEGRCATTLDQVVAGARKFPRVKVAAVVIGGERSRARSLLAAHRWSIPVAQDRDGALSNLYGVAVCPQVVFLREGGVVDAVSVGEVSAAELSRRLSAIDGEA
uniref:Unannotated protein n=1 Tax=freshwater metagenome TaxID=449393 RepID=A0A6J6A003_9ZZZZ